MAILLLTGLVLQAASALFFFFRGGSSRVRRRVCFPGLLSGALSIGVYAFYASDYTLLGGQALLVCVAAHLARRTSPARGDQTC